MASSSSSSSDVGSGGEDGTLGLAAVGGGGFGGVLIPGLPDDLASLILALLPYAHQVRLRATSRSWHALLSTRLVIHLRRLFRLPHRHVLAVFPDDPAVVRPCLFDPAAAAWALLPPLPPSPHLYGRSNFVPVALGHHLYVIGGSHFDANSYPLNHPTASAAAHRLDLAASRPLSWERLSDMLSPRGSFACASLLRQADDSYGGRVIIVAGGGSRHTMYPSEGSRMCSVEYYDVDSCEWRMGKGLPRYRAGCVGFFVRREEREEEEFWVMGGYGDYHVVGGVVPASVYYRDAVVLGLKSGEWREVEDMWEEGERRKLGKVAAVDVEDGSVRTLFMLDANDIFRYDFTSNRWLKESSLQRKIPADESCGFVAMNGELYVLTSALQNQDVVNGRRLLKRKPTLEIQVYNPEKKIWRSLTTNPPLYSPIDFKTATACTIHL